MNENEIIGEGAHGLVKICRKIKDDGKLYAVKILRTCEEEIFALMRKTFLLQKELNHPNIVKAYQLFLNQKGARIHLVMEYCPYEPLSSLLKRKGRLT